MACSYIIKNLGGETILTIPNFDASNPQLSFEEYFNSLTDFNQKSLMNDINNTKASDVLKLDKIEELINDGYNVTNNPIIDSSSKFNEEISSKLNFIQQMGKGTVVLVMSPAEKMTYENRSKEGVVFRNETQNVIMIPKTNELEMLEILNHELSHIVYDEAVTQNLNNLGNDLLTLYDGLKNTQGIKNHPKFSRIFNRLATYPRGPQSTHEFYSWLFGDTELYNYVKSLNNGLVDKILDIIPIDPKGKSKSIKVNPESWGSIENAPSGDGFFISDTAYFDIFGVKPKTEESFFYSIESLLSDAKSYLPQEQNELFKKYLESLTTPDIEPSPISDDSNQVGDVNSFANAKKMVLEFIDFSKQEDLQYTKPKYDKNGKIVKSDEWKKRINAIYDTLTNHITSIKKADMFNISYESFTPLDKGEPFQLFNLPMGSMIAVPFFINRSVDKWRAMLGNDAEALGVSKDLKSDEWVEISFPKLHDHFEGKTIQNSDLATIMSYVNGKGKNGKEGDEPMWARSQYVPFAYMGKQDSGDPYAAVPIKVTYGENKELSFTKLKRYDPTDILGYRKYKGNYTRAKVSDYNVDDLNNFLAEMGSITVYEKHDDGSAFNWDGDGIEYVNNIQFTNKKTGDNFIKSVIKNGKIKVTGSMASKNNPSQLASLAKKAPLGTFIKFPNRFIEASRKYEMVYGEVVLNGAAAFDVIYTNPETGNIELKTVPHSRVTELFYNETDVSDIPLAEKALEKENNTPETSNENPEVSPFKQFMADLYSPDNKNSFILGMGYTAQQLRIKNVDENGNSTISEEDIKELKANMLRKAKPNSVVKYVKLEGGILKSYVGKIFDVDDNFVYVKSRYENELLKIPIINDPGVYNKNTKLQTPIFSGGKYDIKAAIDTVFVDMSSERAYVDHLKNVKKTIKENFVGKTEINLTERKKSTSVKEFIEQGNSPQKALKLYKQQEQESLKSMDEYVDIHYFQDISYDVKDGKKMLQSKNATLSEYEMRREISKLRKGDLILYFDVYGQDKNQVFERWEIITDFDEKTGLPITAHEQSNGRINPRVIKVSNVKAIGVQINPYTSEDGIISIEGRPEVVKIREERKKNFIDQKAILYNKAKAEELVNAANAKFKEGAKVKYEMVPANYITDSNGKSYFSTTSKGVSTKIPNGVEQMYKIVKSYYTTKDGETKWRRSNWAEAEYMITMNEISNADTYDFDTVKSGVHNGSIIRIRKDYMTADGKRSAKYDMFVEGVYENEIRGKVLWADVNSETDEVIIPYFNMSIYRSGRVPTFIEGIYNGKYKSFKGNSKPELRGVSITLFENKKYNTPAKQNTSTEQSTPFSKELENISKSKDDLGTIKSAVDKLNALYDVDAELLNNDDMINLGDSLGIDTSNARGLVYNNKVYINGERASVAEAFHEMGHMILPGLKSLNPEIWEVVAQKVKNHPAYSIVSENYNTLSEEDLVEETFLTIFGEYYRGLYLSDQDINWFKDNPEFDELTDGTQEVIESLFDVTANQDITKNDLLNMSLNQFMKVFGDAMIKGDLNPYFSRGLIVSNNTMMLKLYEKLIDDGIITKNC